MDPVPYRGRLSRAPELPVSAAAAKHFVRLAAEGVHRADEHKFVRNVLEVSAELSHGPAIEMWSVVHLPSALMRRGTPVMSFLPSHAGTV